MNETRLKTVAQLGAFLAGTLEVKFQPIRNDIERYDFIATLLGRIAYPRLVKADKGMLMLYLTRTTGYSRAQLRRLVSRRLKGEHLAKRYRAPEVGFARKFTTADVKLLAQTDALHNTLSGTATECLMQRAYAVPIAQRRAPTPDGRPGFIRIGSVHQGDQDRAKGPARDLIVNTP